jgi:hypothetical protein
MIKSKVQSYGLDRTTDSFINQTALTPEYKEFTKFLQAANIPGTLRQEILNYTQKISSAMMGRIFVRSIPHMELKTGSFEELSVKTHVSLGQVAKWVNAYAYEVVKERGGDNS